MKQKQVRLPYRPMISRPFTRWLIILGSWTFFGLFMTCQSYILLARTSNPISWGTALTNEMTYAAVWALLTPLLFRLAGWFPLESGRWLSHGGVHFVLSFLIAFTHRIVFLTLSLSFTTAGREQLSWFHLPRGVLAYIDYGVMIYWGLILIRHSHEYFRRYRENEIEKSQLESQLVRAQLQTLEMQLQPHFLFNTLNAISVLIQKNPDAARTMITQLSEMLRMTLDRSPSQEVTLRDELAFLDHYLHIEQTRFEDRLNVRREVDPQTLDAFVPSLLLQPIVENAMRHGVAQRRGPAFVAIRAQKMNGSLQLQVEDNGPGFDQTRALREGIGISNTRVRLQQLYGKTFSFDLSNASITGAIITISIPFRTSAAQDT